jgi:hydroxymethylbilane synthase
VARRRGSGVLDLPEGARVGTGSVRRSAQLLARRPDLTIVPLRGNVPTRLRKLESEALDAVVLASAGLDRLGLCERIDQRVPPALLLPAVGQGTLALQMRRDDPAAAELARLSCPQALCSLAAERAVQRGLGGDCTVPLAAYAEETAPGRLHLRALLAAPDGRRLLRHEAHVPADGAAAAGAAAAADLLAQGGEALLREIAAGAAP